MSNQNKNIIIVVDSLTGSGGEIASLALAKGMLAHGYNVHILYFYNKVDFIIDARINTHLFDIQPFRVLPKHIRYQIFAKRVDNYINKKIGKVELLISNLNRSNLIMSYSRVKPQLYVIHSNFSQANNLNNTCSSSIKPQLSNKDNSIIDWYKRIYKKHPCVCVSRGVEQDFKKFFGDVTKTTTIYNAFDDKEIIKQANEFVPKDKNYIIHVGSFYEVKAHDNLLKAYAKTSQKCRLILLGKGKLENSMKELVKQLGIQDSVIFKGFQKNPYPYIKHAKGLVLSSHYEGLGRVLVEAQILKTPAISTDCPSGPNEILPEHCLVPVNDIEALSVKIESLMSQPMQYMSDFDKALLPINIAQKYLDFMEVID